MIVTQKWTHNLSMMQQTVLLTAVRGPDGVGKYHPSKNMLRWFRRCTLLSAMSGGVFLTPGEGGGGSFTGPSYDPKPFVHQWQEPMEGVFASYLQSLDALPHHFQLHFMHASEIVGYKHPASDIREWWATVYRELANDMHLTPETEKRMDERLGDDEDNWRKHNHPATQA